MGRPARVVEAPTQRKTVITWWAADVFRAVNAARVCNRLTIAQAKQSRVVSAASYCPSATGIQIGLTNDPKFYGLRALQVIR